MRAMVGELAAMVDGSSIGNNQEFSSTIHTAKTHKSPEAAAPVKRAKSKTMVVDEEKEITPEQVIPMDDDFKDF